MVDRENALFDVHGVSDSYQKETPELVARSLEELQSRIEQIKDKHASDIAASQDPSFVSDRVFRLKHLRSVNFDVTKAAAKVVRFFEVKNELFGNDRLTKRITLNDLDPEDMECLNSGFCTILPLHDRGGRTVVCWMLRFINSFSVRSIVSWIKTNVSMGNDTTLVLKHRISGLIHLYATLCKSETIRGALFGTSL